MPKRQSHKEKELYPSKRKKHSNAEEREKEEDVTTEEEEEEESSELLLPGGSAVIVPFKSSKCVGSGIGEAPKEIVKKLRAYLNVLFGAVIIEAKNIISMSNKQESFYAIPGVVDKILKYNKIMFKTIKLCITRVQTIEPVDYIFSISRSELILFVNEFIYDEVCIKDYNRPVLFPGGILPIEMFNPFESSSPNIKLGRPFINCAVIADHVTTHIINDIYNEEIVPCADIHYDWKRYGLTLANMLEIINYGTPNSRSCSQSTARMDYEFMQGHTPSFQYTV